MLNGVLYARLRHLFGTVIVTNPGSPMIFAGQRILPSGRRVAELAYAGEEYRVDCPFCRDRRQRLYIGHGYGRADPISGLPMTHLAHCFNEDCMSNEDNRDKLRDLLHTLHNRGAARPINWRTGPAPVQQLVERPFPGHCIPLGEMSADEPAVQYLVGQRRFDFTTAQRFNLHYCLRSDEFPPASGRIIVPIYYRGTMVGWQGRYIGTPPNQCTPKYYACPGMPKRLILYNLDRVANGPFVAVTEGVTDAWRLPDYAVSILGKAICLEQLNLLQRSFRNAQPIVICLDADAFDSSAGKIHELVNTGRNPVVRVRLPPGRDPADLAENALLGTILAQAAEAGITLPI